MSLPSSGENLIRTPAAEGALGAHREAAHWSGCWDVLLRRGMDATLHGCFLNQELKFGVIRHSLSPLPGPDVAPAKHTRGADCAPTGADRHAAGAHPLGGRMRQPPYPFCTRTFRTSCSSRREGSDRAPLAGDCGC